MNFAEFDRFCGNLPHATYVEQWGGSHVWKIGGKVFAIGVLEQGGPGFTFKATPIAYEMMREAPGVRPAPYLASRGMKWLQRVDDSSLSDADLKAYLRKSYELVAAGLPRRIRSTLL